MGNVGKTDDALNKDKACGEEEEDCGDEADGGDEAEDCELLIRKFLLGVIGPRTAWDRTWFTDVAGAKDVTGKPEPEPDIDVDADAEPEPEPD